MITTVTLNAAIDKTYFLDTYAEGKVNRVQRSVATPGGKGLNVARVLHTLGHSVMATGMLGGHNGRFIQEKLDELGIDHDFVCTSSGESRICLNIIDRSNSRSTELLESGPTLSAEELEAIHHKVEALCSKSAIMVFSGSLPTGAPTNFYHSLIQLSQQHGSKVFLDTSGLPLIQALDAKPFFIKPNEDEIGQLLDRYPTNEGEYADACRQIMRMGIQCVVVSLGARGSIAGFRGNCYRITAPELIAVNTVGCGDSFVAGMSASVWNNLPIEDCFRFATAVGSANALTEFAGCIHPEDIEALLPQVNVQQI